MKRFSGFILAGLLGFCILPQSGRAMATTVITTTASYGQPLLYPFITSAVGDLAVSADWVPKPGTRYMLEVKHLTRPDDPFSYDMTCSVYEPLSGEGSGQTVGHYHCEFPSAPTGAWTVQFLPLKGKVGVTVTITGETD